VARHPWVAECSRQFLLDVLKVEYSQLHETPWQGIPEWLSVLGNFCLMYWPIPEPFTGMISEKKPSEKPSETPTYWNLMKPNETYWNLMKSCSDNLFCSSACTSWRCSPGYPEKGWKGRFSHSGWSCSVESSQQEKVSPPKTGSRRSRAPSTIYKVSSWVHSATKLVLVLQKTV